MPATPPVFTTCELIHTMPCLSIPAVLNGEMGACHNCVPHVDKTRLLTELGDVIAAGHGGMTKEGRLVDRRKHPEATKVAANAFLNIGEPL